MVVSCQQKYNNGWTEGIVVNGTMTATGTSFTTVGGDDNTEVVVNSGGHLTAIGSTFAWNNFVLQNGSTLNNGDLTGNVFNHLPSRRPAIDVHAVEPRNVSFQDIDILAGGSLSSGQSLTLGLIGTASTASLRYVFPGAFEVKSGATLSVASNVNVYLNDGNLFLTVDAGGALNFAAASVVQQKFNNGWTEGIVDNGTMTAVGTSFTTVGGGDNAEVVVNSGGHLTASNSTFAWTNFVLANGSTLNSGDLTGNTFATTVSAPATDVPLLASNLSFQDIDILSGGSLSSGQSLTLALIGTASTASLRYVFPGAFTVASGATLSVASNVNVDLNDGNQSLTVNAGGTLNFGAASVVQQEFGDGFTEGIVVNGVMTAAGTSFTLSGGGDNARIQVNPSGGHLTATNSNFAWNNFVLSSGSTLNSGDLTGNVFNTTVSAQAIDVPLLANNASFQDIDILAGDSLNSGQSLTLGLIGTASTAKLRYVFPGAFEVKSGATLTVPSNVSVYLDDANLSLTVDAGGTLNFGGAASVGAAEVRQPPA